MTTKATSKDKDNGNGKLKTFAETIQNAVYSRSRLLRKLLDSRRNISDECGYPSEITLDDYQEYYKRHPIANRVVKVMPKECWRVQPSVVETEDKDQETPFEKAWNELSSSLRNSQFYAEETAHAAWEYLQRVDTLSGIGRYGILLLGIADGKTLDQEVSPSSSNRLVYLRALSESSAQVKLTETDTSSPRYGKPLSYTVNLDTSVGSVEVHWTRVIHVADNLGDTDDYGTPRMEPVFNNLYDLQKLYGGSAEMYWKGAFFGLSFETHPILGVVPEFDDDSLRDTMEDYMNGLQRYLALNGMSAKSLSPQVVDPSKQIEVQIQAICVQLDIPQRVFLGSERGELASSQDSTAWNGRVASRQQLHVTPRIIVPFVSRLITLGILPVPTQGFHVVWPSLDKISAEQEATIAAKRTEALAKYIAGNVEAVMPPLDFLTRIMGFSVEEAQAIVEAAMEAIAEQPPEDNPEAGSTSKTSSTSGKALAQEG